MSLLFMFFVRDEVNERTNASKRDSNKVVMGHLY